MRKILIIVFAISILAAVGIRITNEKEQNPLNKKITSLTNQAEYDIIVEDDIKLLQDELSVIKKQEKKVMVEELLLITALTEVSAEVEKVDVMPEYDIPLSKELQEHTYNLCKEYSIEYELVLSVMFKESSYKEGVTGSAGERSLMQIHPINFPRLKEELGITNFYDSKQNILAGIFMLTELQNKYNDVVRVLMAFNSGESGARELVGNGITSTKYSRDIMEYRKELMTNLVIN